MEWRDVRWWMEEDPSDQRVQKRNQKESPLSLEAAELLRKWGNTKYGVSPGSYYDDGCARAQDINGFHKLDIINRNVMERKAFVGKGAHSPQPAPRHKPVRSATGKARRR